jgi:tetratricopeptide (TPR) repeat protein
LHELEAQVENAPPDEALAAARQLVEILGPLAEEAPAKYLAQLATAWQEYGANLGIVEGPAPAVEPLTTAVRLLGELANDSDAMSLLCLVQALHALADQYLALGQDGLAEPLLQEARQTCRRLAVREPEMSEVLDAKTSGMLATTYHDRGDHPNAIAYGRDAETRLRKAIRLQPMLTPDFAVALRTLAISLVAAGGDDARKKEAQKKIDEALVYHRSLSKKMPELFLGEYAATSFQNAIVLMSRKKALRAAGMYEGAADLYAKAVQLDPGLAESFQIAATTAVETYEAVGDLRRAGRLRQRYGL